MQTIYSISSSAAENRKFKLDDAFIAQYSKKTPDFGFNGLGEFTYKRTYSRTKDDGTKEEWFETIRRVVEGTYTIQKKHILDNHLGWDDKKAQSSAQEMYERIFTMKFLPPGRGLWLMGTEFVETRGGAALENCAFHSTQNIDESFSTPFIFMMDASMLGVGVGFDTRGAGKMIVHKPRGSMGYTFQIPDSREGWVESLDRLLKSYSFTSEEAEVTFDYSAIRPAGALIKGFGGVASGPAPLSDMHEAIRKILDALDGKQITQRAITDIMNLIGVCVIAGNVRRTAQIALGDSSVEYLDLKNYDVNPERAMFGWSSNNSVDAKIGQNYDDISKRIVINGEPGLFWVENAQNHGRINGKKSRKDKAIGINPCLIAGTRVLTREGYFPIEKLVGKKVDAWNGKEWSTVKPKITGHNQPIVKVTMSDGTSIDCTTYHKWMIKEVSSKEPVSVLAKDLVAGQKLFQYDMPVLMNGVPMKDAYAHGFYCGDGQTNGNSKGVLLYGKKQELYADLGGVGSPVEDAYKRIFLTLPITIPGKTYVPFDADLSSRLAWFAGLLDADGTVAYNTHSACLQLSAVNKEFLMDIRLMLTTMGVQAKVTKSQDACMREMPDGHKGKKFHPCKAYYRLLLSASDTYKLVSLGLPVKRLVIPSTRPQRDARRFVTVISVESVGTAETVYCYNEPKNHTATFEGVVTGQCGEQTLESGELCCLSETFPARHDSLEDYKRTLKFAYLYAKTVTLTKTHWTDSNRVMLRNRRIGTSMTGVAQFIAKHGVGELVKWAEEGYDTIQYYDEVYSDWLTVPRSIRTTTVKPSGTVSLLAGATPGIHFPESRYYIRRVRVSKNDPLWRDMEKMGYHCEQDVKDKSAMIVSFPVDVGEGVRVQSDVSMWEQLNLAALMQRHWSDNAVSITVTFKPEEAKDVSRALDVFQYQLKSVSFLPRAPVLPYPQLPYEQITEERYKEMMSLIKRSNLSVKGEAVGTMYCDSDSCQIV